MAPATGANAAVRACGINQDLVTSTSTSLSINWRTLIDGSTLIPDADKRWDARRRNDADAAS